MEMKSSTTKTVPIDMAWLVKIAHEALAHNQAPVVVVSFVDPRGEPRMKQYAEWVMMPKAVFQELTHED
jgi:hypothetical protein